MASASAKPATTAAAASGDVAKALGAYKRKPIIGGNWKSNGTRQSIDDLVTKLNAANFEPKSVDVVVAPTTLHLGLVRSTLRKDIAVSAQNASKYGLGAYTGEICPVQLKDFGINWVILGHSERRHLLKESDADVKDKVHAALKSGLNVIACVGELLSERKAGQTMEVVTRQLSAIAGGVEAAVNDPQSAVHNATSKESGLAEAWSRMVLAYEPVWAIGTGVVATPAEAQAVHSSIREWLRTASNAGEAVAAAIRIQYGGSVSKASCDVLIVEPDIDGFLVGGASLQGDDFAFIVNAPLRNAADKGKTAATAAAPAASAAAAPAK